MVRPQQPPERGARGAGPRPAGHGPCVHGPVARRRWSRAWPRSPTGPGSASATAVAGRERAARMTAGVTLVTSDGEYRCRAAVFALGVTTAWKSPIPGIEDVPHYAEARSRRREYQGKRVFVIGKRNSGFELADGFLPWARQVILGSPRPVQTAVIALASVRVRYLQPYEDAALGWRDVRPRRGASSGSSGQAAAGALSGEGTTRAGHGRARGGRRSSPPPGSPRRSSTCTTLGVRTVAHESHPRAHPVLGERARLGPLLRRQRHAGRARAPQERGRLLLAGRARLPLQRPGHGPPPRGDPPRASSVPRSRIAPDELVPYLLEELTRAPELWAQKSYLARIRAPWTGETDIVPLAHFLDEAAPTPSPCAVETNAVRGDLSGRVRATRGAGRGASPSRARAERLPRPGVRAGARLSTVRRFLLWAILVSLPLAGLVLLVVVPRLDVQWENHPAHFWLVLLAAVLTSALAFLTGETASRRGDSRVLRLSLVFLCASGFLALHALATPGVLLEESNAGFQLASAVGLLLASPLAAWSAVDLGERGGHIDPAALASLCRPRSAHGPVGRRIARLRAAPRRSARGPAAALARALRRRRRDLRGGRAGVRAPLPPPVPTRFWRPP